jgi:hypothetical protein
VLTSTRDDIDTLVSSVAQLTNLKVLNLASTSDFFRTLDILNLVPPLMNLEEISFSGYDVTDDIWHILAGLSNLRVLNIHAFTSFSFEGILAYVAALQETNHGLQLSVMNQSVEHPLSEQEQEIIREAIAAKVSGKFEFTLFQDPAEDEDDSLSD